MTGQVLRLPARLTDKARAMDAAVEALAAGRIRDASLAVLWQVLTSMDNESGATIRTVGWLAESLGKSVRTVQYALRELEAAELIERQAGRAAP